MTAARAAAVLAIDRVPGATPPGVDAEAFRLAMTEDVYEALAALELVDAVLALSPSPQPATVALTWPGTPIVEVAPFDTTDDATDDTTGDATDAHGDRDAAAVRGAIDRLAALGYEAGAVVAADAPDLPGLLIGKLWRALGRADVAVCPAQDGGLVALAVRLPLADWARATAVGLNTPDALSRLRAAAPDRRLVAVTPGWHRLRAPADLSRLDPGLEGWESTRALLSARRQPED